jgi:hypothetical protein
MASCQVHIGGNPLRQTALCFAGVMVAETRDLMFTRDSSLSRDYRLLSFCSTQSQKSNSNAVLFR